MSNSNSSSQETGYFSNSNNPREPIPGLNQEKHILFMDKVVEWLNNYKIEGCPLPFEPAPKLKPQEEIEEDLQDLDPWAREFVRNSYRYKHRFIDTHFNLDHFVTCPSDDRVKKMIDEFQTLPVNAGGFIAVFTDPRIYTRMDPSLPFPNTTLNLRGAWNVLGCPPKHAQTFESFHVVDFQIALYSKNAIAVGPCGLDFTLETKEEIQISVFKIQIQMAVGMDLPLVVQCKMAESWICLDLLVKYAPSRQRIHIQGYEGDETLTQLWISHFPNVFFGLTPVIVDEDTPTYVKDMVKSIPLNRILLESGAPNFVPKKFRGAVSCSHFGFALCAAQAIGELRRVAVDTVLKICRENTENFYGL